MLSHYLIFLCLGVYATCMPTVSPLCRGLRNTKAYLDKIVEKGRVIFQNESMRLLEIPTTLEKECALHNLDKFIKSLRLLKTEESKPLDIMLHSLKSFSEHKALTKILQPQNENQNCEISNKSIDKFLEEFSYFLIELYHLLTCEYTEDI